MSVKMAHEVPVKVAAEEFSESAGDEFGCLLSGTKRDNRTTALSYCMELVRHKEGKGRRHDC